MKNKKAGILTTIMCYSFVLVAQVQQPTTSNQYAVQQTVIKLFDALSNRDSIGMKAYSTADITLYEYGQAWNIDTLILKAITLNQSADFKRTNSFDFINTDVKENMAWVTYRLESVILKDSKHNGTMAGNSSFSERKKTVEGKTPSFNPY